MPFPPAVLSFVNGCERKPTQKKNTRNLKTLFIINADLEFFIKKVDVKIILKNHLQSDLFPEVLSGSAFPEED